MEYYTDVCEKTTKIQSEDKRLQSLTHIEFKKCIRINHTIQNPDFFDIDEIFNGYILNHNKKFDSYLVKNDFKLVFDGEF